MGGGGRGGGAGGYSGGGTGTLSATVNIGGGGAVGGSGGAVTVTNAGGVTIRTAGVGAHGIYAQSVGGGGGSGGSFTSDTSGSADQRSATAKQIITEAFKAYKYTPPDIRKALASDGKALGRAALDTLKSAWNAIRSKENVDAVAADIAADASVAATVTGRRGGR